MFLNTVPYDVELEIGTTRAYGANVDAENTWNTANNEEGYREDTFYSIVNDRFEWNAVRDGF